MPLTPEEKRQRRIDRAYESMRALRIGTIFRKAGDKNSLCSLFQKLVRMAAADANGMCVCVTCGVQKHWKEMNGGHYISVDNKATALDPLNVHPQCPRCNQHLSGNLGNYRIYLVERYGEEAVAELESKRLPANHIWNRYDLAEIKINLMDEVKAHERRMA